MTQENEKLLIILTEGRADNGRKATLAFSMGLSAVAMNVDVTMFLTSDAAIWGYKGSAKGVSVPGFLPMEELVEQYIDTGGRIALCSTCHLTCGPGEPLSEPDIEKLPCIEVAGMATIIEIALGGTTMTF